MNNTLKASTTIKSYFPKIFVSFKDVLKIDPYVLQSKYIRSQLNKIKTIAS